MINQLAVLDFFEPISLKEMDGVKLLDRTDTKYMFRSDQLVSVLHNSRKDYKVLSINGSRFSRYETHYFDTSDLEMYTQHHNGRLNRHKVRFRDYLDSGTSYFEVKFKSNKGRTIKYRVKLDEKMHEISGQSAQLLSLNTQYDAGMLSEAIQVNYNRITLVNNNLSERVTIDTGLTYIFDGENFAFHDLVIAEVKQDRTGNSAFVNLMQSEHIHSMSMSKYCLGIASMNKHVKSNRFKPKLLNINKLCHENA